MSGYDLNITLGHEHDIQDKAVIAELQNIITQLQQQFIAHFADLSTPPHAKVFIGAAQSIPDSTDTMAAYVPARGSLDSIEEFDPDLMYEQASKAFVITKPGLYVLVALNVWDVAAGGSRTLSFVQINNTTIAFTSRQPGSATNNYHLHTVPIRITQAKVDAGPVKFGVQVFQSSGGALNLTTNSWFAIYRIAKL